MHSRCSGRFIPRAKVRVLRSRQPARSVHANQDSGECAFGQRRASSCSEMSCRNQLSECEPRAWFHVGPGGTPSHQLFLTMKPEGGGESLGELRAELRAELRGRIARPNCARRTADAAVRRPVRVVVADEAHRVAALELGLGVRGGRRHP